MKRLVLTVIGFVFVATTSFSPVAAAEDGDCSKLGKYEWASFAVDGSLYAGYESSMRFNSSAYRAPFTVHGFGTTTTSYAFFQPPTIAVPNNVQPGNHYLWVEQCGRKVAEFNAYVNEARPWALASKWYVEAGETINWEAYNFRPGELVELYANGKKTNASATALTAYAPKHGINLQGRLTYNVLNYQIPNSLKGSQVSFELKGTVSKTSARTTVTIAR